MTARRCWVCGTALVRRYSEGRRLFAERRCCSPACGAEWKRAVVEVIAARRAEIEGAALARLARQRKQEVAA